MEGHLVGAVFHRAKASLRCISRSVHLVRQLLQPVEFGVAVCSNYGANGG
jgi:hypothetical protein